MFLLNNLRKIRKNPEISKIKKARRWLEETHPTSFVCYGDQPFIYLETSQKGEYRRYHFYQDFARNIVYVVLSDAEKNEIENVFKERKGNEYRYKDTILCDNIIIHRFGLYRDNILISNAFMNENGEINEGEYV